MYYIGVDIGGTYIKCGIVTAEGEILIKEQVPTQAELGAQSVMDITVKLIEDLIGKAQVERKQILGIGAGIPGLMDTDNGVVLYNNNLGWTKVKFSRYISSKTGFKTFISNDANVAALGEAKYGMSKEYSHSIMVTLGTGVGGGIIIDGKLFEGGKGAGAELGHMVVKSGGNKCTCGRRGCLETYGSATALVALTKAAMLKNKDSQMWEAGMENVSGKTAFEYMHTDSTAKKVVNQYVTMLAEGLANLANIFRPNIILLGGGISKEGEPLVALVKEKMKKRLYGGKMGPPVEIGIACLRNDAGFLGGAALAMQKLESAAE